MMGNRFFFREKNLHLPRAIQSSGRCGKPGFSGSADSVPILCGTSFQSVKKLPPHTCSISFSFSSLIFFFVSSRLFGAILCFLSGCFTRNTDTDRPGYPVRKYPEIRSGFPGKGMPDPEGKMSQRDGSLHFFNAAIPPAPVAVPMRCSGLSFMVVLYHIRMNRFSVHCRLYGFVSWLDHFIRAFEQGLSAEQHRSMNHRSNRKKQHFKHLTYAPHPGLSYQHPHRS